MEARPLQITDSSGMARLFHSNNRCSINAQHTPGTVLHPEVGQDGQAPVLTKLISL